MRHFVGALIPSDPDPYPLGPAVVGVVHLERLVDLPVLVVDLVQGHAARQQGELAGGDRNEDGEGGHAAGRRRVLLKLVQRQPHGQVLGQVVHCVRQGQGGGGGAPSRGTGRPHAKAAT